MRSTSFLIDLTGSGPTTAIAQRSRSGYFAATKDRNARTEAIAWTGDSRQGPTSGEAGPAYGGFGSLLALTAPAWFVIGAVVERNPQLFGPEP